MFHKYESRVMVIDYIIENYTDGEPIFLEELPCKSKDYLRQEMKKLVDEGRLERLYNGLYYLPYTTILGTKGKISIEKYLDKKYLNAGGRVSGYITGLQLANQYGFTTQNPSCYEICSNEATTKQRKQDLDGNSIIVYKPVDTIDEKNRASLQFLDLMTNIDKYSEIKGKELSKKLVKYVKTAGVDFSIVKKYLQFYPDKVYRNIYQVGFMGELI